MAETRNIRLCFCQKSTATELPVVMKPSYNSKEMSDLTGRKKVEITKIAEERLNIKRTYLPKIQMPTSPIITADKNTTRQQDKSVMGQKFYRNNSIRGKVQTQIIYEDKKITDTLKASLASVEVGNEEHPSQSTHSRRKKVSFQINDGVVTNPPTNVRSSTPFPNSNRIYYSEKKLPEKMAIADCRNLKHQQASYNSVESQRLPILTLRTDPDKAFVVMETSTPNDIHTLKENMKKDLEDKKQKCKKIKADRQLQNSNMAGKQLRSRSAAPQHMHRRTNLYNRDNIQLYNRDNIDIEKAQVNSMREIFESNSKNSGLFLLKQHSNNEKCAVHLKEMMECLKRYQDGVRRSSFII